MRKNYKHIAEKPNFIRGWGRSGLAQSPNPQSLWPLTTLPTDPELENIVFRKSIVEYTTENIGLSGTKITNSVT